MVSLGGLSGLGAVYPGYIKTMGDSAKARAADYEADMQVAGDKAFANSLQAFNTQPQPQGGPFGGGGQPAAPPMAPGQPSVSGGPPNFGPASTGVGPVPGGGPPGLAPAGAGAGGPPAPPPGGGPQGPGNGPPMGSFGGAPLPQGPGVPTAPPGFSGGSGNAPGTGAPPGVSGATQPPGAGGGQGTQPFQIPGQQPGGQGGQGLDWRTVLQHVIQSNPGAPPGAIAYAVNKWLPVMNAASQQEWRMVQTQLREQQVQNQLQIAGIKGDVALAIAGKREDIATANREERARETDRKLDAAMDRAKFNAGVKEKLLGMNLEARQEAAALAEQGKNLRAEGSANLRRELQRAEITDRDLRQDKAIAAQSESLDKKIAAQKEMLGEKLAAALERTNISAGVKMKMGQMNIQARNELAQAAEAGRDRRWDLSANLKRELQRVGLDDKRSQMEFKEAGINMRFAQGQTAQDERLDKRLEATSAERATQRAFLSGEHDKSIAAADERAEKGREASMARTQAQIISRADIAAMKEKALQGRFDIREARMGRQQILRTSMDAAKLSEKREEFEQRAKQWGDAEDLRKWRAVLDAEHRKNTEIIQSFSMNNMMPDDVKQKLLQEEVNFYNGKIKELRSGGKSPDQAPSGRTGAVGGVPDSGGFKITPITPGAGAQGVP